MEAIASTWRYLNIHRIYTIPCIYVCCIYVYTCVYIKAHSDHVIFQSPVTIQPSEWAPSRPMAGRGPWASAGPPEFGCRVGVAVHVTNIRDPETAGPTAGDSIVTAVCIESWMINWCHAVFLCGHFYSFFYITFEHIFGRVFNLETPKTQPLLTFAMLHVWLAKMSSSAELNFKDRARCKAALAPVFNDDSSAEVP